MQLIVVAVGGALGAILRFLVSNSVSQHLGREFPYGTLTVNLVGSLVMGFLFVMIAAFPGISPHWRSLLLVGFLGAFTTFSTFSLDTLDLALRGEWLAGLINIGLSVVLCIGACWLGMSVAKLFFQYNI